MINDKLIAERILEEVYGPDYTGNDVGYITEIINYRIPDNKSKANAMCEYMDIPKRHNRAHITQILDKYNY